MLTTKFVAVVAVPPIVLTEIGPVTAFAPTVAVRRVVVALVTAAGAPPIRTTLFAATASKFVPLIATLVPGWPCVGVNEVIVGAATYVNPDANVPEPPAVVTVTLAAPGFPAGVVAVSDVADTTTTFVAAAPPIVSVVAPASKFEPVTVTLSPPLAFPRLGVTELTVGGARYVKAPIFVTVPVGAVTVTSTAPAAWDGVVTVSVVAVAAVTTAGLPPKVTLVLLVVPKFVPVIVTVCPPLVRPFAGCKAVMVGVARMVSIAELLSDPSDARTVTVPGLSAVARPVASMLASPVSLVVQVTRPVRSFVLPSE
ncbi:MAG TPA: hypothetical protein VGJ81_05330 [Thermoanaerobaculia bacterium]